MRMLVVKSLGVAIENADAKPHKGTTEENVYSCWVVELGLKDELERS